MGRSSRAYQAHAAPQGSSNSGEMGADASAIMMQHERIVFLSGDVNEHSIASVQAQLIALANYNSTLPIRLIVSTYGGSVDEMFSLYDTIQLIKCPVYTIGLGKVMSAGVLLLASGVKGKRLIGRHARVMMHPISGGSGGNVFEVINDANEHKRLQDAMVTALQSETGMKRALIEKIMSVGHDYYITAEKAVELGIVDSLI